MMEDMVDRPPSNPGGPDFFPTRPVISPVTGSEQKTTPDNSQPTFSFAPGWCSVIAFLIHLFALLLNILLTITLYLNFEFFLHVFFFYWVLVRPGPVMLLLFIPCILSFLQYLSYVLWIVAYWYDTEHSVGRCKQFGRNRERGSLKKPVLNWWAASLSQPGNPSHYRLAITSHSPLWATVL